MVRCETAENPWKSPNRMAFWRYSAIPDSLHTGGVTGSIPVAPTIAHTKQSNMSALRQKRTYSQICLSPQGAAAFRIASCTAVNDRVSV
jgi:hypothetical protein